MNRLLYISLSLSCALLSACRDDEPQPEPEVIELSQNYTVAFTLPDSTTTSTARFDSDNGLLPGSYTILCNNAGMGTTSTPPSTPSTGPFYTYTQTTPGAGARTFRLHRPDGSELINVVNPSVPDIHMLNIPASISQFSTVYIHFSSGPVAAGESRSCFIFQNTSHWAITDSIVGDSMFVFIPADLVSLQAGNATLSVTHNGSTLPLDQNDGSKGGSMRYSATYEVDVLVN
jgi:hypothetical protein